MDSKLLQDIRKNLDSKSTPELLQIWQENNRTNYSEDAFEVVRSLLQERGEKLPSQKPQQADVEDIKKHQEGVELTEINEHLKIPELTDEELFDIVQNHWNYPKSFVAEVEKEIDSRSLRSTNSNYETSEKKRKKKKPNASSHTPKDEGIASFLDLMGYATIIIGVIIAFVMLAQFSKPGMFSDGKLGGSQLLIVFGVAFYHLVFGMLSLGVAKVLRR